MRKKTLWRHIYDQGKKFSGQKYHSPFFLFSAISSGKSRRKREHVVAAGDDTMVLVASAAVVEYAIDDA
jgi:hypothetical protein